MKERFGKLGKISVIACDAILGLGLLVSCKDSGDDFKSRVTTFPIPTSMLSDTPFPSDVDGTNSKIIDSPDLRASPTPAAVPRSHMPTTSFTETSTPTPVPEYFDETDIPSSLDFILQDGSHMSFENIGPVDLIPEEELEDGKSPYPVPDNGIATLKYPNLKNLRYIWGHSADPTTLERRPFADIELLNEGDLINVEYQDGELSGFKVVDIIFAGLSGNEEGQFLRDYEKPTLIIQSSAKTRKGVWIMNPSVMEKEGTVVVEDVDGDEYRVLMIIAERVEVEN